MSDVNTDELSAFLNRAWNNARDGANTLPEQLLIEQQAVLGLIAPAGSLASVSKNAASQSMGGYNPGNLTQRQLANIFSTLIRYYQVVKAKIISEAAKAAVVLDNTFDFDQPVYDLLTTYLQVAGSATVLPDISDLRIPLCRPAGGFPTGGCC